MELDGTKTINMAVSESTINSVDKLNDLKPPRVYTPRPILDEGTHTNQMLDKATGLMQSITSDKLTEEIIRKMPPDEYLQIVSLLDDIVSGSVDNEV